MHSNESMCRKNGRLGLDQVSFCLGFECVGYKVNRQDCPSSPVQMLILRKVHQQWHHFEDNISYIQAQEFSYSINLVPSHLAVKDGKLSHQFCGGNLYSEKYCRK